MILEDVYNRQLSKVRNVVKNAFGILFFLIRKLLGKNIVLVLFISDVIACCCMFYNLILNGMHVDVNALMF
jgi:hypothetical protein